MIDQGENNPRAIGGSLTDKLPRSSVLQDHPCFEAADAESDTGPPHHRSPEEQEAVLAVQLQAVGRIYQLHWQSLLAVARHELSKRRVPSADYSAEDVLQSGFGLLVRQLIDGNIDAIEYDSGALRVLRRLIVEKVINRSVYLHALKRMPARNGHNAIPNRGHGGEEDEESRIADRLDLNHCGVPPADVDVIALDLVEHLLERLNREQRTVARMRLDTYSVPDIASRLGLSRRTVERRLEEIRDIWAKSGLLTEGASD